MASSDDKTAAAHAVGDVAVSLGLLSREAGDLAALLGIASVAVEHDAGNPGLDVVGEAPDGSDHHGRALAVATTDDDGVRALGGGQVEEALCFAVGGAVGAFGKDVGADAGSVRATDTLARDLVVAVSPFQARASGWTDSGALV